MDEFVKFSSYLRNNVQCPSKDIHVVLGNESCDLDSMISCLAYAYYLQLKHLNKCIIPILNVSQTDFQLRTANCFVLKQFNIDLSQLIYRDSVNLSELSQKPNFAVTLVDHHVLNPIQEFLKNYVVEIYDHRPVDPNAKWCHQKVKICIDKVGSCCTLIANEILNNNDKIICTSLAQVMYSAIIFDTIGFKPSADKATKLDYEVAEKLENILNIKKSRLEFFNELWKAHNDVSHLTPKQLLNKDLKVVGNVLIPGLPMLVQNFLEKEGASSAVKLFLEENSSSCVIMMGIEASPEVKRDIGLYPCFKNDKLTQILVRTLTGNEDFMFEELPSNLDGFRQFNQRNLKLTRKQLLPVVKEVVSSLNHN